jgi:hypothetical protein
MTINPSVISHLFSCDNDEFVELQNEDWWKIVVMKGNAVQRDPLDGTGGEEHTLKGWGSLLR